MIETSECTAHFVPSMVVLAGLVAMLVAALMYDTRLIVVLS